MHYTKKLLISKYSISIKILGFALVYTDVLKKEKKITKKIDNRSLLYISQKSKKKFIC